MNKRQRKKYIKKTKISKIWNIFIIPVLDKMFNKWNLDKIKKAP